MPFLFKPKNEPQTARTARTESSLETVRQLGSPETSEAALGPSHEGIEAALLRPVPRRVRASRALRRMRWAAGNAAGLLVAAIALVSSGRALHLKDYIGFSWFAVLIIGVWAWREIASRRERRLLRTGVPVRASLLSVTLAPSPRVNERRFRVVFGFTTSAGEALTRAVTVDEERADKLRTGNGTATLLYDPADPQRAEPYFTLEDAEIE